MSTHGDGGKGSGRRKEDVSRVKSNWDLIDWSKKQEEPKMDNYDEDEEVICTICGTEMSPTEHGRWLHCDVCGNTRDFDEDDSNYE